MLPFLAPTSCLGTDQFPSDIIFFQPEELQNLLKSRQEFSQPLFLEVFTNFIFERYFHLMQNSLLIYFISFNT